MKMLLTNFQNLIKKFVQLSLKETAIHPDEPVTGDIHRLIRLPGSLHGGNWIKSYNNEL